MDSEKDEDCSRSSLLRDDEAARRLELAALNHVALGEWEAARANLTVLASRYPGERKRVKEILISLVLKAREHWTDSVSVPSPHHLCWLALQTFMEIFPESEKEIPASVQLVVQFCLLLNSCCHVPSYSEPIAEWLTSYQAMLVSDPSGSTFKPHLHLLPPYVTSFLLQVLTKDPPLGHALVSSLLASSTNQHYVANNESLQLLYLDCIEDSLKQLPVHSGGGKEEDSQYESDAYQHSQPKEEDDKEMRLVERVYTMLSFLDPTANLSKVMIRLEKILEVLLQASPTDGDTTTLFTREEIYSCFLGRSSPLLIRRLQDMEGFQRNAGDSMDDEREAGLKWKKVFFDALQKDQHFLANVMDRGIKLICSGQLNNLAKLLSYSDLVPLRPLLLLLGWDKNPDVGSGKELLDTLWPRVEGETTVVQQLLYDGCSKLAFQVSLVQWCLDKARPFLPADSSPSSTSAGDVFQGLKSHSILYVLHHSTPLSLLDSNEVIEILKLRPDSASLSPKHLPTPSPFSPPPSPSMSSYGGTPKRSSQPSGTLKPEQERDITIYRSFCCLKLVMEAVWTSILLNHGIIPSSSTQLPPQPKTPAKASRKLSYPSVSSPGPGNGETEKVSRQLSQSEQTYQQEVVGKLEQAKTHLSAIFPLNYRLEVLENIFSLLFLTGDDIRRSEEGISSSSSSSLTGLQSSTRSSIGSETESLSGVHSLAFICKQQGFLVGETLADDLLNLLKGCMFELTAAKYALLTRDSAIPPSSAICSSVSPGSLQQRITKLQKQINEAKWRLELVSSKHGISSESKDAGGEWSDESSGEDSVSDTSDKEASGSESSVPKMRLLDSSDNRARSRSRSRSGQTPSPSCIKQPRPMQVSPQPSQLASRPPKRGSARHQHGGGAGSSTLSTDEAYERSGNCADIEERSPDRGTRKKRLRTRTSSSVSLRQKGSAASTHPPSIICQMLATPDNLLCKCLKHNNYQRAREVLKMFVMEGQLGEALVNFSEQFEIISRDLVVQSRSSTPRPSPSTLTPGSEISGGSASGVGVGGVQTAMLSMPSDPAALESLHRLLAPAVTSRMLFASDPQLEQVAQDIPLLVTLQENVPALTMLDIVCSSPIEGATAKKVIQMAVTRSKTALDLLPANMESHHAARKGERRSVHDRRSSPGDRNTLMGPLALLHIFSEVSGYFILGSQASTTTLSSPHSLLTQFPLPLAIDSVMNWKTFMDSYWEARDQVEAAVQQCSISNRDVLELAAEPTAAPDLPSKPVLDDLVSALSLNPVSKKDGPGVHFLWHFGQYLSKLVGLLLKCHDVAKVEGTTQNQLMLSVLRHSPMKLIGRLVFEKSIVPQTVEKFLADLPQLKIVEVIIKCCCPSITNSSLPNVSWQGPAVYALNQPSSGSFNGSTTTPEDDDPCALSHKLLSKLLTTLKGLCQTEDGVITPHNLLTASQSSEMKKILSCTSQLSSVSLGSLQNRPEHQLAFYCNVVNLLYAHAIIMFLQWEGQEEGCRLFGGTHISLGVLQSDTIVQSLLFSRVGYHIGELGLISCYDLHHNILRAGFSPPFLEKTSLLRSRPGKVPSDPWSAYVPSQPDPRVLFVISNGTLSSPLPRLLQPEHVNSELDTAETKYIRSNVTFDLNKYEINIPKLLDSHRDDFIPNKSHYDSANPYRELSNIALGRYIAHKQPTEIGQKLSDMLDACDTNRLKKGHPSKLKMGVVEEDCNIGYAFPLKRKVSMLEGSTPPPHSPSLKKKPRNGRTYEKIKPYMFTNETMDFVRTQSKLLGSLVVLLCPPENSPSHQQLDMPASDGQVIPETDEVEREMKVWEKEKEVEMQRATAFAQTVSHHPPPAAAAVRPTLRRTHSMSEDPVLNRPCHIWREVFDSVMTHFDDETPLKEFMMCRLKSFEGILPWDRLIQEASVEGDTFGKDPEINLRRLAVLPCRSMELSHACSLVVRKLLKRGLSDSILRFITKEPVANNNDQVQFAVDLALTSSFSKLVDDKDKGVNQDFDPLMLLYQLTDPELAARLTLSSLEVWTVETCVDLLTLCFYHLPLSSTFLNLVDRRLKQLQTYLKIMDVVNDPLSDTEEEDVTAPWNHWAALASDTKKKPDHVLGILLMNKAFSLAREWARVHDLDVDIHRRITGDYIYDLLEGQESPDPYTAQGVLEDLPNDTMKMQVCEQVLKRARELESIVLLLQFMLTKLEGQITDSNHARELTNQLLGAKALLMLPRFIRRDYRQFMAQPLLIAEQLLMDLKIDWAGLVIKELMDDKNVGQINMEDTPILEPRPSVLTDDVRDPFTELLMFYAEKSLQFPTMIGSQGSVSRGPSPSIPATPRGADRVRSPSESTTIPPTPRHRRSRSGASIFGSIPESAKYSVFEPPPRPPPKEAWETDPRIKNCRICKTVVFGMFNRRQYCRRCGRAVCGACSAHTMSVEGYDRPQRVCNDCYNHHMLLSGSSEDLQEEKLDSNVIYPNAVAAGFIPNQWQLIACDAHYNTHTRMEFYYEQAPSTPLCLRIIDLMKDIQIGAGFILHCCHSVSLQLVPDPQGRVNEEVDHYFTISIISNLLLNAKLRYARAGDSAGVELCDTYLSRVDLLRLMVSARYPEISSIQELTKPDLARRVRDRLIVDDRFDLAMEVATKCQLDTTAVWSAWGMASLKCGDYQAARERLHHCFQISSQSFAHTSSHLLERIVEQIIASPLASIKQSDDWTEVFSNTMSLTKHHHEGTSLDRHRFSECRFYLTTYGSPNMLVSFLSRHNCWYEACVYVLDQHCPTEVFVDGIWVPAIKSGHLTNLEDSLKTHDPSLAVWEPYLTAVCRMLSQKGLLNVLYHTQLFMRDYVRAAMTCIKFFIGFKGRATTTQELFGRLSYLSTAHQHFEIAVDGRPQGDSSRRGGAGRKGRDDTPRSTSKSMSVHEIHTHINTIKLQQRVTGLLYEAVMAKKPVDRPESLSAAIPGDSGRGSQQQQPATLFGTGQIRGEVICQLLTMCRDMSESFQLANEIVVAYRLPAIRVFTDVATRLANKDCYNEVRQMVQCIAKSNLASPSINDEVCLAAIKVLASQSSKKETKQPDRNLEKLIQMIHSDQNRIKALIQCGKLKNAYLVAIRARLHSEVEKIGSVAAKAGQSAVRDICEKWLLQNKPGSRR